MTTTTTTTTTTTIDNTWWCVHCYRDISVANRAIATSPAPCSLLVRWELPHRFEKFLMPAQQSQVNRTYRSRRTVYGRRTLPLHTGMQFPNSTVFLYKDKYNIRLPTLQTFEGKATTYALFFGRIVCLYLQLWFDSFNPKSNRMMGRGTFFLSRPRRGRLRVQIWSVLGLVLSRMWWPLPWHCIRFRFVSIYGMTTMPGSIISHTMLLPNNHTKVRRDRGVFLILGTVRTETYISTTSLFVEPVLVGSSKPSAPDTSNTTQYNVRCGAVEQPSNTI